jgi:type IV pilus assembly protein PilW
MSQHATARLSGRGLRRAVIGFSLIELMISITLGLIILTGVALIFANTSNTRNEIERVSRQIENGRYAVDVLTQDLRLAGYYGELNVGPLPAPAALTDPCSTAAADWNAAIPLYLQGYNAGAGAPASCLPASLNFQPGTDILVLRRARTCAAGTAGCDAAINGKPYVQVSLCASETTANVLGLEGTATFNLTKKNCTTLAAKREYYVRIYFVSSDNGAGQNIPTLKRLDLTGSGWATSALVEGIEQFNLEYGLDTSGDGAPDAYVADPNDYPAGACNAACQVANWMNVVTVHVHVLARNLEPSIGYTDSKTYHLGSVSYTPAATNYRRHVYSALVRPVNPAGRRDTP